MSASLTLERYGPLADEVLELPAVTTGLLAEIVHGLSSESSAHLTLEIGTRWLSVSASNRLYAVGAQLEGDEAFNLVGDPMAKGSALFNLGGQEGQFPRRYLVDIERVVAAASYFLRHSNLDHDSEQWDRQGENDAWQQEGIG